MFVSTIEDGNYLYLQFGQLDDRVYELTDTVTFRQEVTGILTMPNNAGEFAFASIYFLLENGTIERIGRIDVSAGATKVPTTSADFFMLNARFIGMNVKFNPGYNSIGYLGVIVDSDSCESAAFPSNPFTTIGYDFNELERDSDYHKAKTKDVWLNTIW